MWPGIYGNAGGSAHAVSIMRKHAVQASRFMLQMMQTPLYEKETQAASGSNTRDSVETSRKSEDSSIEWGEEGLAIRISIEVNSKNCELKMKLLKLSIPHRVVDVM